MWQGGRRHHSADLLKEHFGCRVRGPIRGTIWQGLVSDRRRIAPEASPLHLSKVREDSGVPSRHESRDGDRNYAFQVDSYARIRTHRLLYRAEMFGHSSIRVMMDTYSHVLPDMQRQATAAMEQLFETTEGHG